ncbi:MAG TPA: DUF1552 domain-containing protein [Opitutaceae bacterium]|nr:DUF1552 domain-containing protein [Opitutaceae bacterium]
MSTSLPGNRHQFTRRRFLHGAGVVMALPWLESLPVWGAEPMTPQGTPAATPKRLAVMFMANGVNQKYWNASGAGEAMQLGESLSPLEPVKTRINYVKGLFNKAAVGVGIHPGMTGNLLSGAPLTKGAELHGGVSMDQVLATRIGDQTVQPSMVLGCEQPQTGYHETNFSMAYSSHISWQTPTSPVPMEVYPSLAFDSLFDNQGAQRNQSVLDRVKDQADSLARQVSAADRAKIDEYLTSVREVEKRAESMRAAKAKADAKGQGADIPVIAMKRPQNGLPEDIREHMRLMCDIVALGFQTDKTRLATLLLCRDISGLVYPFLDAKLAHHLASHEDDDAFMRINKYYVSQYAYLIQKLAAMKEGEGSVLDNSCIVFMSNMWSGKNHDSTKVPLLTAGSLGGTMETGRVLDYTEAGNDNRKLCSLYLSLMDRMGVKLDRFGDAETRLAGI